MLCLMFECNRRGYLQHGTGKPFSHEQIARMVGCSVDELVGLLQELDDCGVFSRTEQGAIYSRRMAREEVDREGNSQRQRRYRNRKSGSSPPRNGESNGHVTPLSHASSSSSSSSSSTSKGLSSEGSTLPGPELDLPPRLSNPQHQQRAKSSAPEQRGTRLNEDFELKPDMKEWASLHTPHVDLEAALEEFIDYWRALPGTRGYKLDWVATWRNRMRELEAQSQRYGRNGNGASNRSKSTQSLEATRSYIARKEAEVANGNRKGN